MSLGVRGEPRHERAGGRNLLDQPDRLAGVDDGFGVVVAAARGFEALAGGGEVGLERGLPAVPARGEGVLQARPGNSSGQGTRCTMSKTCVWIVWVSSAWRIAAFAASVPMASRVAAKRVPTHAPGSAHRQRAGDRAPRGDAASCQDGDAGGLAEGEH